MTTEQDVDAFLEHFGVKGMRWGHTTKSDTDSSGSSTTTATPKTGPNYKKAAKVAGVGLAIVGVAAVAVIVSKNGGVNLNSIRPPRNTQSRPARPMPGPRTAKMTPQQARTSRGERAVAGIDQSVWRRDVGGLMAQMRSDGAAVDRRAGQSQRVMDAQYPRGNFGTPNNLAGMSPRARDAYAAMQAERRANVKDFQRGS